MSREKIEKVILPDYTKWEEYGNALTHVVGAVLALFALLLVVGRAVTGGSTWSIVAAALYGESLVAVYAVSGVYHGLPAGFAKRVMRVVDHCTIYYLIAGTYTPVLLCGVRAASPVWCWALFTAVWGLAVIATFFTAADLQKSRVPSMICYLAMGWCIVLAFRTVLTALPHAAVVWLLAGGVAYTVGALLYLIGKKCRYMHTVFHLFVLAGSMMHFLCVWMLL